MQLDTSCPQLTQPYIHSVRAFQEQLEQYSNQERCAVEPVLNNPRPQPAITCTLGSNPSVLLSLSMLRCIHADNYTLLLAEDRLIDSDCSQSHIVLLVHWDQSPRNNKSWVQNCTYRMTFTAAAPTKQKHKHVLYSVTLPQITIQTQNALRHDPSSLKLQGNKYIQDKNYYDALIAYEIALGSIYDINKHNARAILYSNSSMCFYEMRLFANALIYAQIANRIDPNYTKGFFRKLTSLLELKQFQLLPHCLLKLSQQPTIDPKEKQNIEIKFYNYLANFIGLFNWKEVFKNGNLNSFGEYTSEKITIRNHRIRIQQQIKPFQLLLLTKPLIHSRMFNKASSQAIFIKFLDQISKCCRLQSSFNESIECLPSSELTLQCDLTNITIQEEIQLQNKVLCQKIQSNSIFERTIQFQQPQVHCGIYPIISHITHNCEPNCSILHIKGAIALFAFRPIKPSQSLSIDFVVESRPKDRKRILKMSKNIDCQCQYCTLAPQKKGAKKKGSKESKAQEGAKIRKERIWETILNKQALKSKDEYRMTLDAYAEAVDEEPTWDALLNLAHVTVDEINEEVKRKCKGVIIKAFCSYFKVSPTTAEEILLDMRK